MLWIADIQIECDDFCMHKLSIYSSWLILSLVVVGCSDHKSSKDTGKHERLTDDGKQRIGVVGAKEEGSDSTGSVYYIADNELSVIAERATKGDNIALMRIINHYRFSYEGNDRDALVEKWEKIGADRANAEPVRSSKEIQKSIFEKDVDMAKLDIGRELRGVAVDYFRLLKEKHSDCSVLKEYAEKAQRAKPDFASEISTELQSVCKI